MLPKPECLIMMTIRACLPTRNNRAAGGNHVEIMNYLMEKGAPVDQTDKSGRTALHWAVISGHKEATDILLGKVRPPFSIMLCTNSCAQFSPVKHFRIYCRCQNLARVRKAPCEAMRSYCYKTKLCPRTTARQLRASPLPRHVQPRRFPLVHYLPCDSSGMFLWQHFNAPYSDAPYAVESA